MKWNWFAVAALVTVLSLGAASKAALGARTYYLQLVSGTDDANPPTPKCEPIGPKLSERLRAVFRWKRYWELKRDTVDIDPGQKVRRQLCKEREVELELLGGERLTVRIYTKGVLTSCRTQPCTTSFCVVGGEEGERASWFIIVRSDAPQPAAETSAAERK